MNDGIMYMATVTTPVRSRNLAEAHQRVRSPLERLRRFIRLYVSLEGAAVVGLFLALWFWIGLIFDYGFFRLFHIDWVQELPWGVRCGVLVVLLSGLTASLALKVLTRLFREFRDVALALVLERRFPKILGDRLITAVELADPKKSAAIGYSAAMVQETIHEAAQRVEQLKIKEVFDWERLTRRGIVVGLLLLGGYLAAGTSFSAVNAIQGHGFTAAGFSAVPRGRRNLVRAQYPPAERHLAAHGPFAIARNPPKRRMAHRPGRSSADHPRPCFQVRHSGSTDEASRRGLSLLARFAGHRRRRAEWASRAVSPEAGRGLAATLLVRPDAGTARRSGPGHRPAGGLEGARHERRPHTR